MNHYYLPEPVQRAEPDSLRGNLGFGFPTFRFHFLFQAEGRPQSFSSSLLLDLPASRSGSVAFRFPPGVVDGSQRVSVTAIGTLT